MKNWLVVKEYDNNKKEYLVKNIIQFPGRDYRIIDDIIHKIKGKEFIPIYKVIGSYDTYVEARDEKDNLNEKGGFL